MGISYLPQEMLNDFFYQLKMLIVDIVHQFISYFFILNVLMIFPFLQAFTPICLPSLTYLNIQGNPLDQNSVSDLLDLLRRFTCLRSLEVDLIYVVTFFYPSKFSMLFI